AYKRAALKDGVPEVFPRFFAAVLAQRGEFEEALENFRIRHEREKRPEIKEYWKGQIRSSFHNMVLNALRRAGDEFRRREGRVPPPEAVPGLPGFEKLELRPSGRARNFSLFRTRPLTVPPAGTFAETILYDPARGVFGGLFRIVQDDLDRKLVIRDAAARYRGERGALPPGRAGIQALVASGCLSRAYPHPLSGGYVLDADGEPASEDGWEDALREAGE
ncbi:MAG: hypothetical protein MUC63_08780, partial [Planctomycetes bacterium]|nr:hypothetical protein [Planctomycetota bacterium]